MDRPSTRAQIERYTVAGSVAWRQTRSRAAATMSGARCAGAMWWRTAMRARRSATPMTGRAFIARSGIEPRRQPEEREVSRRVEEERDAADATVLQLHHLQRPRLVSAARCGLVLPEGRGTVGRRRDEP